uniref:Uncharacterized protein n=1 Tax=Capra hircus TaxID=9925 RepID=A0A8C2SIP4_CAPHI
MEDPSCCARSLPPAGRTPNPQNDADPRRQFPPWGADEAAGNRTSGIIPSIEIGCWTEEAKLRHQGRGEGLQ